MGMLTWGIEMDGMWAWETEGDEKEISIGVIGSANVVRVGISNGCEDTGGIYAWDVFEDVTWVGEAGCSVTFEDENTTLEEEIKGVKEKKLPQWQWW